MLVDKRTSEDVLSIFNRTFRTPNPSSPPCPEFKTRAYFICGITEASEGPWIDLDIVILSEEDEEGSWVICWDGRGYLYATISLCRNVLVGFNSYNEFEKNY